MAKTPDIKVTVTPTVDTDKLDAMKAAFQAMGEGLAKVGAEMKPALDALVKPFQLFNQNVLTQQQVCLAFGIEPESIGLLAPDALDGITEAIQAGTITSDVLPMDTCPANTAPYVAGQLGINAKLVSQQPTGWHTKTSAEILADIQQAADAYKHKGKTPMPDPIKAKGMTVAPLDAQGNPTGEWKDVGSVVSMDLSFAPSAKALAASETFAKVVATEKLDQMAQTEMQVLSNFLGVDVTKGSGNLVTVEKSGVEPDGPLAITVTGPEGETIQHFTVPESTVYALMDAAYAQLYAAPVSIGQEWLKSWKAPTSTLSDHASGMALDLNMIPEPLSGPVTVHTPEGDEMHFEIGSLATGEPVNLGHTEAVAEALKQKKALDALHGKITTKKGGIQYPTPKSGPTGATCIPMGGGNSQVQLSGVVYLADKGNFSLNYAMIVTDDIAEMLVGFTPIPEGVELTMPLQSAAGEMFAWNPQTGWEPQVWVPTVSTTPGMAKTTLSDEERTWCTWHEQHWADPTHMLGVSFECGSSQFSRPSTPLEDKQVLARLRMLHDTGLA